MSKQPEKLKVLDLCSGIGGFSLGMERTNGFETIAFCEIDNFCRKILKQHWPEIPIFEDIRKLKAHDLPTMPDVITAGYPCQPFSVAGKRSGDQDDRHLWPEVFMLLKEIQPYVFIGENVTGHISMGLDQVLSDLENENYSCQTFIIPACAVDAQHRRDRIWIVAYSESNGYGKGRKPGNIFEENGGQNRQVFWQFGGSSESVLVSNTVSAGSGTNRPKQCGRRTQTQFQTLQQEDRGPHASDSRSVRETVANPNCERELQPKGYEQRQRGRIGNSSENVPNTSGSGLERRDGPETTQPAYSIDCSASEQTSRPRTTKWPIEPGICRVVNGLPNRVDRIKGLGNAVVPQIVTMIGRAIIASRNLET